MKLLSFAAMLLVAAMSSNVTLAADMDDLKWVSKCIQDNAATSVGPEIVAMYCACMNHKMGSSESESISDWEKSHTDEKKQCESESGWK